MDAIHDSINVRKRSAAPTPFAFPFPFHYNQPRSIPITGAAMATKNDVGLEANGILDAAGITHVVTRDDARV